MAGPVRRAGGWAGSMLVVLLAVALCCPTTRGALQNSGFEQGGTTLPPWTTFNNVGGNVAPATTTPHSGQRVCKLFGGYNGNPNWSGLHQSLPAAAGQLWEAGCWVRHNTGDALAGANHLVLKIEFYRAPGGQYGGPDFLGEVTQTILDGSAPRDVWAWQSLQAVAPGQAVEARIAFVYLQYDYAGGAALLDDVAFAAQGSPGETWQLIWADEFDGPAVDPARWRIEDLHLVKNNELQYYAPDEVYLENGELVLRSRARYYCGYNSNGQWCCYDYTSGLVETRDRFATAYGRVEVRAKLPATRGLWPAHWMMPTSGGWPPEIDIMELLGHEPWKIYMSHHWGTWPEIQSDTGSYSGPDFSQGYHTFALEWFPDRLDFFVDELLCYRSMVAVPQEPFYLILNTAVGGNWPGNPDGSTVFPQYHRIDYVRVFVPADPGAGVATLTDGVSATATADGVIAPDEYAASVHGINAGVGDRIGANSVFRIDSGAAGQLALAFEAASAWPTSGTWGVVVYVDAGAGGWASTVEFDDRGGVARRLASGKGLGSARSDLYFAPGFRADYALVLEPGYASVFALDDAAHLLINGAALDAPADLHGGNALCYRIDDGSFDLRIREVTLPLAHLGLAPGASLRLVATMLDGDTGFRASEFIGVAAGNPWDGYNNPGASDVVLKPGDFIEFNTAPRFGDHDADGDVDGADFLAFESCLGGPGVVPAPPPPLEAGACLNTFDTDLDGDSDLVDFALFQELVDAGPA